MSDESTHHAPRTAAGVFGERAQGMKTTAVRIRRNWDSIFAACLLLFFVGPTTDAHLATLFEDNVNGLGEEPRGLPTNAWLSWVSKLFIFSTNRPSQNALKGFLGSNSLRHASDSDSSFAIFDTGPPPSISVSYKGVVRMQLL